MTEVIALPPMGMIALRVLPETKGLRRLFQSCTGKNPPKLRQITFGAQGAAAWMGPDEYLLMLPPEAVPQAFADIDSALGKAHHMALDVSDMRVGFELRGGDDILAALTPADLSLIGPAELRRSRIGQVAAAFWRIDGGWHLLVARSTADYVFDLLSNAAKNARLAK